MSLPTHDEAYSPPHVDPAILDRNLRALRGLNPRLADRLLAATPRPDLCFMPSQEGALTADLGGLALASRYRPRTESERLASTVNVLDHATVIVHGFGLGYHVEAIGRRLRRTGVLLVLEPDLGLLRAVLERIDHSEWIAQTQLVLFDDPTDRADIAARLNGAGPIIALGTTIVEPPVSRTRLGSASAVFDENVTKVVASLRTLLCTTLVHASTTCRNLLLNLDQYAAGAGLTPLLQRMDQRPAIVVSAGPSLARNIELLMDPAVRERFVLIAAQTVLKPLLRAGIRPHFVTALDYHEISRQFHDGLTADDVRGITLVIEPKVNRAVVDAWPGAIRCVGNPFLDQVLGIWRRDMGDIGSGATVAQMSLFLAQALGCDPIVFVGQDLGFSEGLYYGPGAAIHDLWSAELNPFNTLEMMEWQRIMRMKRTLQPALDIHGRPMLVDEQMRTYLQQFERDFASAPQRIIDATEGGVPKLGAERMSLAAVLAQFGHDPLPPIEAPPPRRLDGDRLTSVRHRITELARRARDLRGLCDRTSELIGRMLSDQTDDRQLERHFQRLDKLQAEAAKLQDVIELTEHLNQLGVFKRLRADRRIALDDGLTPIEVQRAQLERDQVNLQWLGDSAEELAITLDESLAIMRGERVCTRINTISHRRRQIESEVSAAPLPMTAATKSNAALEPNALDSDALLCPPISSAEAGASMECDFASAPVAEADPRRPRRVAAMIAVDPERSGLGLRRRLDVSLFGRRSVLQCVLERLGQCREFDSIVLIVEPQHRARVADLVDITRIGHRVIWYEAKPMSLFNERAAAIATARRFADRCWRGGVHGMSIFDEVAAPRPMLEAAMMHGFDAALVVGADWPVVDPSPIIGADALVARYREKPDRYQIVFSPAPPGLGACVLSVDRLRAMATADRRQTIGGTLVYIPELPQIDPIAKDMCVVPPNAVRTWRGRLVFDGDLRCSAFQNWSSAARRSGVDVLALDAPSILQAANEHHLRASQPEFFEVELCRDRPLRGPAAPVAPGHVHGERFMPSSLARRIIQSVSQIEGSALTFGIFGEPLDHPEWSDLLRFARDSGIATIHLRTDLQMGHEVLEDLISSDVDIISVRMNADCEQTYRRANGSGGFHTLARNLEHVLQARNQATDLGLLAIRRPWIVPTLVRCPATLGDMQSFFDRWVHYLGAAVIEPEVLPSDQLSTAGRAARRGFGLEPDGEPERLIVPLPPPHVAAEFRLRTRLVRADGMMPVDRRAWTQGPFFGHVDVVSLHAAEDGATDADVVAAPLAAAV